MREIKIYFASKIHHAAKLKSYRREGFHFVSRWLDSSEIPAIKLKPASHWLEENFIDIQASDYVIVYASKEDYQGETEHLKTALIEAGYAMAFGKPVIVIGDHESYRPWRANSKRVTFHPTIEDALFALQKAHAHPARTLDHTGKEIS